MEKLICPECKAELTGVNFFKFETIGSKGRLFADTYYFSLEVSDPQKVYHYSCPNCEYWLGTFYKTFANLAEFILAYKEKEKRRQML